jgi:hypothetical protein
MRIVKIRRFIRELLQLVYEYPVHVAYNSHNQLQSEKFNSRHLCPLELSGLDISWLLPFRRTLDLILIVVTLSLNNGTSCWLDFNLRPLEPTLHLS